MSADDLESLVVALGHARKPEQRRAAEAIAALAGGGMDVRPRLLAALADDHPRRPWGAAYALSRLGEPPAACLPVLLDAMGDADGDLRWAAATIVLEMRSCQVRGAALLDLARGGSALQRKMALYVLRDLEPRAADAIAAGLVALGDADPSVRMAGMALVAAHGAERPEIADAVARLVVDADPGVARAATATLGRVVATPITQAALASAAEAQDASVRRAAAHARRRSATGRASN